MSVLGTSRSHFGHQRFCWMRVWHSPWSWLKLRVAPASVAGNTLIGMLTRLIFRYPFQVGRAAIGSYSLKEKCCSSVIFSPLFLDGAQLLVDLHLIAADLRVSGAPFGHAAVLERVGFPHFPRHEHLDRRLGRVGDL